MGFQDDFSELYLVFTVFTDSKEVLQDFTGFY